VRWQSRSATTSSSRLRRLDEHSLAARSETATLVMAGKDDPIVPLVNARLICRLIPNAALEIFDCGHLFLLTRAEGVRARDRRISQPTLKRGDEHDGTGRASDAERCRRRSSLRRRAASAIDGDAIRTAGELIEVIAEAADGALAFNPLIGLRGRDVAAAAGALLEALAKSPTEAIAFLGAYVKDLRKRRGRRVRCDGRPERPALRRPGLRSNFLCKR